MTTYTTWIGVSVAIAERPGAMAGRGDGGGVCVLIFDAEDLFKGEEIS